VATSNSSSIRSEAAFDQVHDLLRHTRFPPAPSEIEAALARNGNDPLLVMTELLSSSTGLPTVNGVATTSHSSTNNNELRMDIDPSKNETRKLPAAPATNELTLDEFLSMMKDPDNNIFKHCIVEGKKLPEELYKFTGNNILEDYSLKNESELEQHAVGEFGDKTRSIRPQTLSAAKVLLCLAMQNSFAVEGVEEVGPLRAGNDFLEERDIHVMSIGATQSMQYRVVGIALREFFGVPSETAHAMAVHSTLWLETIYCTLYKKAGSKGQKDHDVLVRLLKASAKDAAECNRDLIEHTHITDVIVYGSIAQNFVSDNNVLPSGVHVYESPHSCSLVQGTLFRSNCEALMAPIAAIKRLIGDKSPVDMDKVMKVVAMELTSFTYETNVLRSSANFIITASYSMRGDNDKQDIVRAKGTGSMKRLLNRLGITFGNSTFPTQDKFFDSSGELVPVQWKGLTMKMMRWDRHNYFDNDFGSKSGGFGAREGSLLQHYIQNQSRQGKDERTALTLVVTKTNDGDITSDDDCMIVCGAALEFLKEHTDDSNYLQAFKEQKLQVLFEGLVIGGEGLRYDTPMSAFGRQAVIKKNTYNSIEDMLKVLPVNVEALTRAMDSTDISDWVPTLHLFKPATNSNPLEFIGSISKLKDLQPVKNDKTPNEEYPWPDEQEARPACNRTGDDGTAINKQLGSLRLKAAGHKCKWANGAAVLTAIRDKDSVTIECPTIPSSNRGYDVNENKEAFIFAAVRLDKDDDNDDDNNKNDDSHDDIDEDQYY